MKQILFFYLFLISSIISAQNSNRLCVLSQFDDSTSNSQLLSKASKALSVQPFSVTSKSQTPPSGDKHDYMSLSPYWWPNPATENGLPYVKRDGERNPEERTVTDKKQMQALFKNVELLALTYQKTQDLKYARKADTLLRVWFLDEATHMNPNLNYAQSIKGKSDGRGVGIIDARGFIELLDAVEILRTDSIFEKQTYPQLVAWFDTYLIWLDSSANGIAERNAANNHGTWFSAQYIRIAYFVGKEDLAKSELELLKLRMHTQFLPDGEQPLEMERTLSVHYSLFNLEAYFKALLVAEKMGISLWDYSCPNTATLTKSLYYTLNYLSQPEQWKGKQIKVVPDKEFSFLIKVAVQKLNHQRSRALLAAGRFVRND